jgi:hypothetical protein
MKEKITTQMFVAQAMPDIPIIFTRVRASVRLTKAKTGARIDSSLNKPSPFPKTAIH